ncbi:Conserved hypothetical protein [gamma proteobacterium HdN1]|nr:Conserved hypothetical protein [gamma proteobacterium HdN1]
MDIEVAYATPAQQWVIPVSVPVGTCVLDAIQQSGILQAAGIIGIESMAVGVFGKSVKDPKTAQLNKGDRIEIYRPLLIDPKTSRKRRAAKAKGAAIKGTTVKQEKAQR